MELKELNNSNPIGMIHNTTNQESQLKDTKINDNPIRFQKYEIDVEAFNDTKREIKFTFATNRVDRSSDVVNPQGAELEDFLKNPVFLWMHDKTIPPIGKVVAIEKQGSNLIGVVEFWKNDNPPSMWSDSDKLANSIYEQYKNGFLKAVSIAFRPIDATFNRVTGGNNYNRYSITEISAVTVPDNPDALIRAKSMGIDMDIVKSYCEKALKTFGEYSSETFHKENSGQNKEEIIKSINNFIKDKLEIEEIIKKIQEELINVR